MIRKIAALMFGISCVGLIAAGAKERFAPGVYQDFAIRVANQNESATSGVYGTYTFDESGSVLGKVPWRAHIELELKRNGRYEIRMETEADGDTDVDWNGGRFRTDGDRIVLLDRNGEQNEFSTLRIEGDRLRLDANWPAMLALKMVGVSEATLRKSVGPGAENGTAAIEQK